MSLLTALSSGTTGLEASSLALSVIGDNISNSSTVGFKAGRATFEDALSQSVIGGTGEIGLGARIQSVQKIITQGALSSTGISTDLALQGNGYFVVAGSHNGQTANFYTRAGQFTLDRDGYLVNLEGLRVQGFPADAGGNIAAAQGDLMVGAASALPQATADVTVRANLQADATVPAAWDPTSPGSTSNFSTSMTIYDSIGTAHQVQMFFRRSGTGAWEWHAMTDGGTLNAASYTPPAAAGALSEIASGTLAFDGNGALTAVTQTSNFVPFGQAAGQALNFNFGDPTSVAGGTGLSGVTQFSSASATTFIGQDGYGSGQLSSISFDAQGHISGIFTNGQTRILGQVAVAGFSAPDQLQRVGGNLYAQSPGSGQPVVGAPGDGGRASVISGALEQSNVDLADQFVQLISAQRTYEANSKIITTADQLLSELIQMKR